MRKQKEVDLSRSALQIYVFLLKKNPLPVLFPEIKEATHLPKSTIHYNLDRLKREGLIEETAGGYIVKQFEQLPALKHYMSIFGKVLPKYILFSAFFFFVSLLLIISELLPQIKFLVVVLSMVGFLWSVRLVYKYRL